ncbi:MAG TPA: hypothetical protein VGP40_06645, partial [Chthoniobacterales bacterium]|nr:hypothetical protein [Chthoniobacterales bacterium]
MFHRALAFSFVVFAAQLARGQEVILGRGRAELEISQAAAVRSAWLDLRQNTTGLTGTQTAPGWVKAVTVLPQEATEGVVAKTIFRIQLAQP